MCLKCH
jgi:hypothetical protein